jgi:hypothetical protein
MERNIIPPDDFKSWLADIQEAYMTVTTAYRNEELEIDEVNDLYVFLRLWTNRYNCIERHSSINLAPCLSNYNTLATIFC